MKTLENVYCQTSSVMRFLEGEEVSANLDWDDNFYYLWFEPTWQFEDFCESNGVDMLEQLNRLRAEIDRIGMKCFCDLEAVNRFCERYCGDDEPAGFYYDEILETVCGV